MLVEEEGKAEIKRMEVREMIGSDHHRLIVWMKRGSRNRDSKGRRGKKIIGGYRMRREERSLKAD